MKPGDILHSKHDPTDPTETATVCRVTARTVMLRFEWRCYTIPRSWLWRIFYQPTSEDVQRGRARAS